MSLCSYHDAETFTLNYEHLLGLFKCKTLNILKIVSICQHLQSFAHNGMNLYKLSIRIEVFYQVYVSGVFDSRQ